VEQTFERVAAWVEADGKRVEYPRDPKAREHPSIAPYVALEGGSFTFEVDVEGRVLRVDGLDELLRRAFDEIGRAPAGQRDASGLPDMMALEAGVLTPDATRQWVEQGLRIVPGREVRRGETWRVDGSQELPFVGTIDTGRTFTLDRLQRARDGQIATIEMRSSEKDPGGRGPTTRGRPDRSRQPASTPANRPDPNDPAAMLGEMRIGFTLVERSMTGQFRFDTGAGQMESGSTRQVMEWEVQMPDIEAMLDPNGRNSGESVVRYRIEQTSRLRLLGSGG
jgi:hypothetical protein